MTELDDSAIQIEGDCLALITTIQHSAHLTWDLMLLWKRTMHMLTSLDTWTINYCKCVANRVADVLAKYNIPTVTVTRATLPPHIRIPLNEEKERRPRTFYYHRPEMQASSSNTAPYGAETKNSRS